MSAQHTPGPWLVMEDDELLGFPFIPLEAANPDGEGFVSICEVGGDLVDSDGSFRIIERTRADARLIAAAPCVVKALEEVTDLLVATVTEFGSWNAEDHPKVIAARAALSRALGEGERS